MRGVYVAALLALAILAWTPRANAECAGHDQPRFMLRQSLLLLLNPMGAQHEAQLGLCIPLYPTDDPILSLNNIELGIAVPASPVFVIPTAYVQVTPASFLSLRADLGGLFVWPIPMPHTGYYTREGYGDGWSPNDLPEQGGSASGWTFRLMAVLRGLVELAPGVSLLAFDGVWVERDVLDHGAYWVDVRDDVIVAQGDWMVANEAMLLLESAISEGPRVRFGAYSSLRAVPAAGYVGHQSGPILMLAFPRPDTAVADLAVFIRLGFYSHHAHRAGEATTMAGLMVDWDLGGWPR